MSQVVVLSFKRSFTPVVDCGVCGQQMPEDHDHSAVLRRKLAEVVAEMPIPDALDLIHARTPLGEGE